MAIVRAAAEMVLVTSRQWRTGYSLSRTIFVWENLCAGIPNHFKVFIVFVSGCNWFLPLKKEERKQLLPLPYLNLYKDAILADFFFVRDALWEGVHLSLHSPSLVWALAHSGSVAANNNTALPIFLPARLPCGYWNCVGTPCVAARFFQEHLPAVRTAQPDCGLGQSR